MSYRSIGHELRNWGRWGTDDERGTANLIGPEAVRAAADLIRDGRILDLSLPLDRDGPQTGRGGRDNPVHIVTRRDPAPGGFQYADDYVMMPLQCATQLDALAHVSYDGFVYNGFPAATVGPSGAARAGIDKLGGLTGRGVLLDVARFRGVDRLEPGYSISPADLAATAEAQGVRAIGPGAIVLVRTGWIREFLLDRARESFLSAEPGLGLDCARWLAERDVAAVCADNFGVEVVPAEDPEVTMPLHCVLVRDRGMTFGELFDLEELSVHCAVVGRWEFFLTVAPLKVTGGLGSPVTPLAIF